jgi:hypothetical protein
MFFESYHYYKDYVTQLDRFSLRIVCKQSIYCSNLHFFDSPDNEAIYLTPPNDPIRLYTSISLLRMHQNETFSKYSFVPVGRKVYPFSSFYLKMGPCGWGVYAKRMIPRGEVVLYYTGECIRCRELADRRPEYDRLVSYSCLYYIYQAAAVFYTAHIMSAAAFCVIMRITYMIYLFNSDYYYRV